MKIKTIFAGLVLLTAQALTAQTNLFVAAVNADKTTPAPGFGGECTRIGRMGWTEVHSASFSLSNTPASTPGTGGAVRSSSKVVPGNFTIAKTIDGSSQFFLSNCMAGKIIPILAIDYGRTTGQAFNYQSVILYDVIVASYEQSASTQESAQEVIALNYTSFEIVYNRTDRNGSTLLRGKPYGWNWRTNTAIGAP